EAGRLHASGRKTVGTTRSAQPGPSESPHLNYQPGKTRNQFRTLLHRNVEKRGRIVVFLLDAGIVLRC
ncbi:MAG TPA: hypothetical protein VIU02_02060, partial [Burkholderiales bacterium]